jgi:uncharacterized membrane protein YgdD (TMEM256/DUF423 family)
MRNELVLSSIIIILLVVFLNPFNLLMPPSLVMMLIVVLIVLFGVFAAILWKEKPQDEREALLSQKAGRTAFLTGTTVLILGIVYQEYHHSLDPWLIYALVAMILGKLLGLGYGQKNN